MQKIKLAIIGCGAISRVLHLPVVSTLDHVDLTVLVDKNSERAQTLAEQFNVPVVADDYTDVTGDFNTALVALPHYLHAPVAIDLLDRNIHVLTEKPMALTTADCRKMITAAESASRTLAVGLDCRFFKSSQLVRELISNGLIGPVKRFDFRVGNIFSWSAASDFMFRKDKSGGGVLIDIGSHILDLMLWWLGDYQSVTYYDDAMGGVEADCEIHLQLASGAAGIVELSRTRQLRNSYIIEGELGILEIETGFNPHIKLKTKQSDLTLNGFAEHKNFSDSTLNDVFARQFKDFTEAVIHQREPFVSGRKAMDVVKLIEQCYAAKRPLNQPWNSLESNGSDTTEVSAL
jgi:predicted dehydrogenase